MMTRWHGGMIDDGSIEAWSGMQAGTTCNGLSPNESSIHTALRGLLGDKYIGLI
jgi:hypothetical protein